MVNGTCTRRHTIGLNPFSQTRNCRTVSVSSGVGAPLVAAGECRFLRAGFKNAGLGDNHRSPIPHSPNFGTCHTIPHALISLEQTRGLSRGIDMILEDQPLIVGALALAIGAALGSALPRTEVEDELLGPGAGRLKQSASDLLRGEGEKAGAGADEAMKIVDEAAGELARRNPDGAGLVDSAKTAALSASDRLRTVAEEEVEKQNPEIRDRPGPLPPRCEGGT